MKLHEKYKTILEKGEINTPLRLAHFFSQIDHESAGFTRLEENLNYSASGLLKTFGKYFDVNLANNYARKPEKIANRVYANRMGNGYYDSGDGWKYRGRGFIQLTGKYNYDQLSKDTGIDYLSNPDLLLNESDAMISAIWFWNKKNLSKIADKDDIVEITRRINGGLNGIEHRKELLKKYKQIF